MIMNAYFFEGFFWYICVCVFEGSKNNDEHRSRDLAIDEDSLDNSVWQKVPKS